MAKWRCPRCKYWTNDRIGKVCQGCVKQVTKK